MREGVSRIRFLAFAPLTYSHPVVYAPLETPVSPNSKGQIMVCLRQGSWKTVFSILGKGGGIHSRKPNEPVRS